MSQRRPSHVDAISYAARPRVLLKYVGQLCLVLSVLALPPAAVAAAAGELPATAAGLAVATLCALLGAATARLSAPRRIQRNEAFAIAAMIFPLAALAMAGPFAAAGLPWEDALFESVSGITTTGLSTLSSVESRSPWFLFGRAWLQWCGGLGIVVLGLALAPHPGIVTRRLGLADNEEDDLVGGTRAYARRVLLVYASLTLAGWAAVAALGVPWFDALIHSLAAVSTGGFSSHDASLAAFPSLGPQLAVLLTCLACSLSLPFYWRLGRKGWRTLLREVQLWGLLAAVAVCAALLTVFMARSQDPWTAARHAGLMALSAQTTAGFSTTSVADLDAASKLTLIFSMAIGGGAGSTAGGFKILRLLVLLRAVTSLLVRSTLPKHAVYHARLGGRRIDTATIEPALLIVVLFGAVVALSWLPFVACGYDPLDSLFEVVSATGTVGLSAGVSGGELPVLLKAVLCLDMLSGRLEFVALLILLFPRTWFGKRLATP